MRAPSPRVKGRHCRHVRQSTQPSVFLSTPDDGATHPPPRAGWWIRLLSGSHRFVMSSSAIRDWMLGSGNWSRLIRAEDTPSSRPLHLGRLFLAHFKGEGESRHQSVNATDRGSIMSINREQASSSSSCSSSHLRHVLMHLQCNDLQMADRPGKVRRSGSRAIFPFLPHCRRINCISGKKCTIPHKRSIPHASLCIFMSAGSLFNHMGPCIVQAAAFCVFVMGSLWL